MKITFIMKFRFCLGCVLFFILHTNVKAQNLIAPDRPGIGNASFTVAPGHLYLESGILFSDTDGTQQISIGQLGFRTGLTNRLELQLLLNSASFITSPGTDSGIEDIALGFKTDLVPDSQKPLQLALLTTFSIPTGSVLFSDDIIAPNISVIGDYSLSNSWTLSSNAGHSLPIEQVDGEWLLTITPSFNPIEDSNTNIYFGYAGIYQTNESQHFLELGAVFFPQTHIQIDVNSGYEFDLNSFFIGAGFSIQLK